MAIRTRLARRERMGIPIGRLATNRTPCRSGGVTARTLGRDRRPDRRFATETPGPEARPACSTVEGSQLVPRSAQPCGNDPATTSPTEPMATRVKGSAHEFGPGCRRAGRRGRRGRGFRRHRRLGRTAPDVRPGGHGSAARRRAVPGRLGRRRRATHPDRPGRPRRRRPGRRPGGDLLARRGRRMRVGGGISWPDEVAGACWPGHHGRRSGHRRTVRGRAERGAETAEIAVEGRLVVGVLRDRPGGSCLLRWRSSPQELLRGPGLAPGLLAALHATFED